MISIAQFTQGNTPVVWRGPMLHRALQQFLADVFWGDLDILLLDLPPGTGDVAISVAQLIPNAEILVVTTPQQAAAEVAERAGAIALQTRQRVVGRSGEHVLARAARRHADGGVRIRRRAGRRGTAVARRRRRGAFARPDPARPAGGEGGDDGTPIVLSRTGLRCGKALLKIADKLVVRRRGLAGMSLGIDTARR